MVVKKLCIAGKRQIPQETEEYKKVVYSLDEECIPEFYPQDESMPEHYRAMAELLPEDEDQRERNKKYRAYSKVHFKSD